MVNSFLNWVETVDWNHLVETALSYSFVLYLLPFPIIAITAYFLCKSLNLPSRMLRLLLTLLVMLCFVYYHQTHMTPSKEELNFHLIGAVAIEYIAGASFGLLAIFIFTIRVICSSIKKSVLKKK